jgi:hypothetical protein
MAAGPVKAVDYERWKTHAYGGVKGVSFSMPYCGEENVATTPLD